MNKLPLSPEDVTEFTCDAAQSLDLMARHAATAFGNRCFAQEAIAAEWAHRIAVKLKETHAWMDLKRQGGPIYNAALRDFNPMEELARITESAYKYVAWLDSLKGGQNAQ